MRPFRPFLIATLLCGAILPRSVASQSATDPGYDKNAFATFRSGVWTATAAFFGENYTYGPEYQCRIGTKGATFWQRRPNETREMPAEWQLLNEERQQADRFEVRWVAVNGKRWEVTGLPWRLIRPPDDGGIILMSDRLLLSVRADPSRPWVPFTYLTLEMLSARSFEIGYSLEINHRVQKARRKFSLVGFREAAKWCGRQLLRDRQDQKRVRALTR